MRQLVYRIKFVIIKTSFIAGKSRASKKLQISGPKGEVSSLIDGRPKSFVSVTDIK